MPNKTARAIRAFAIVGFIIASSRAAAQPMDLPLAGAGLTAVREALRKGETYAAIIELRRLEKQQPRDGQTVMLLAYSYYLAGQRKLFALKAKEADQLLPQSPEPPYSLGRYYLDDVQRCDLASAEFRRALERDSRHAASLYHLGWCLEQDKQPEAAAANYRKAGNWLAEMGLARLALENGDEKAAQKHAANAVRLQPMAAQAHATLARIFQRQNDCKQAIPPLRRATELDPIDAPLLYQLARCAQSTGDRDLERASLERYNKIRSLYSSQ